MIVKIIFFSLKYSVYFIIELNEAYAMKQQPKIIVHGGAWEIPQEEQEAHIIGCYNAVCAVWKDLQQGMPAQEAVCTAIRILEEDETFDAGKGGVLRADGTVELDASLMIGSSQKFASVMNIKHYMHPIDIAHALLNEDFSILSGTGAEEFASEQGFPRIENIELIVERERQRFQILKNTHHYSLSNAFIPHGTVGAVVYDMHGNLAAGTSTGGVPFAPAGRIGDTPLPGAGTYCDNTTGGASATGFGEAILRVLLTRTACDLLRKYTPMESAKRAVDILYNTTHSFAGIILINNKGEYGIAYNTTHLARAYIDQSGNIVATV